MKIAAHAVHVNATLVSSDKAFLQIIGYHVLWPQGFAGRFDLASALIALGAAVALFRYKRNVIHVIAACALVGWVVH